MEEKKLNERESLELITRMIQETKNKLEVGDGNDMGIRVGIDGYPRLCHGNHTGRKSLG